MSSLARRAVGAVAVMALIPSLAAAQEYIRVPERQTHTDVKAAASSGSIVLVLVPGGTTLPVVRRQGEWLQVKLTPALRHTGIPMRWFENEELGFVHESTVEVLKGTPTGASAVKAEPAPTQPPREYVRVPARQTFTDVKQAPNSTSIVLLLVPAGTALPVVGRRGEWIEVTLSPELRQVGTPMRWYKGERSGFVHESTVEPFKR